MAKITWFIEKMEQLAPAAYAADWDNVGLLVGDANREANRVLTALELSEAVLKEAVQGRFDLLLLHHPIISRHVEPINSITTDRILGKKLMTLIGNGISVFCAHTNLDAAHNGINDILFEKIGLVRKDWLFPPDSPNPTLGRTGFLPEPTTLKEFAAHVKQALNLSHVRYVGEPDKPVRTAAICGGNGTDTACVKAALEHGCDVYLTGDLRHHMALDALELGLGLVDGTHYATEAFAAEIIADYIKSEAEKEKIEIVVESSKVDGTVFRVV